MEDWLKIIGAAIVITSCILLWWFFMNLLQHKCAQQHMHVGVVGYSVHATGKSVSVSPVYGCVR
jgi:hypothetical protein